MAKHKIGITGHNEEEIASMTAEEQARCFLEYDDTESKPTESKPKKKK